MNVFNPFQSHPKQISSCQYYGGTEYGPGAFLYPLRSKERGFQLLMGDRTPVKDISYQKILAFSRTKHLNEYVRISLTIFKWPCLDIVLSKYSLVKII